MRTGNRHGGLSIAPYNVYPASDGHLAILSINEKHWKGVMQALDNEHLCSPAALPATLHGEFFAAGNGAGIYEPQLRAQCAITGMDASLFPSAEDVVPLALQLYAAGGARAPELALPVYLRDEVWKKLPGR